MEKNKFRAWHNVEKTFKKINSMYFSEKNNEPYCIMIGDKPYIFPNKKITILSYTGLKDCKGREIFEGDIIEFVVDEPLAENREKRIIVGFVDFDRGSFWINTKKRFYDGTNYTDETLLSNFAYCCEVVGSIYENRGLLK